AAGPAEATGTPPLSGARRIAVVASSSEAAGQASLLYPARDAARIASVLEELGGFAPDGIARLPAATPATLRAALDRAEATAVRPPGTVLALSSPGHADAEGLLLGGERFRYAELRERLQRSHAAVRVALLDACQSGAAARAKGGRPVAGYAVDIVDPT